ncbi:MAG: type II toxin-antitoxin system HipA family toxin [Bacteroidales bacterium]|nr:type II toxin-antitoxin system HipA family toxin [Bacteroidales bacterium]
MRKVSSKVNVVLWGEIVGVLSWDYDRQCASFQFTEEYLHSGYEVSPIAYTKAKIGLRPFFGNRADLYQGLPEFIADSLPDHWGNTLFSQWVSMNRIPLGEVNPLMKLSFIGNRGMGAFEFVPCTDFSDPDNVDLDSLYRISLRILREKSELILSADEEKTLEKLVLLGTSAGGKHAKGVIAVNPSTGEIRSGQVPLPPGFVYSLIKFKEDPDVPTSEIEMVYYRMARLAGIDMMPSYLLDVEGVKHFVTERFDRKDGDKIHSQTLAAISPSARDYTNLFWIAESLKLDYREREQIFRRMAFNFISGVTDDHNKNFSFLMDRDGRWSLSPAYDVMFTANIWETPSAMAHSLSVGGKNAYVTSDDLLEMGEEFGIRSPELILGEVAQAVRGFPGLCAEYGVDSHWGKLLSGTLAELFPQLNSL